MTKQQAIAVVQRERFHLGLPPSMKMMSAEKAIVEHTRDRSRPGLVEDRIAWIVQLASSEGVAQVRVDDGTGEVLEVLRSA